MRVLLAALGAVFLASCASTPRTDTVKVYDHKYNTIRYAPKQTESDFVGTSANASGSTSAKPSWYRFGHP